MTYLLRQLSHRISYANTQNIGGIADFIKIARGLLLLIAYLSVLYTGFARTFLAWFYEYTVREGEKERER